MSCLERENAQEAQEAEEDANWVQGSLVVP